MPTIRALTDLPKPTETSISIITPAKVNGTASALSRSLHVTYIYGHFQITLGLLEQAKALSIPALWLQPGAEDASVIQYIQDNGLADKVIYGGPCILVEGDDIIKSLL